MNIVLRESQYQKRKRIVQSVARKEREIGRKRRTSREGTKRRIHVEGKEGEGEEEAGRLDEEMQKR